MQGLRTWLKARAGAGARARARAKAKATRLASEPSAHRGGGAARAALHGCECRGQAREPPELQARLGHEPLRARRREPLCARRRVATAALAPLAHRVGSSRRQGGKAAAPASAAPASAASAAAAAAVSSPAASAAASFAAASFAAAAATGERHEAAGRVAAARGAQGSAQARERETAVGRGGEALLRREHLGAT